MTATRSRPRSDRLDRYHAKRDFTITGEPRGAVGPPTGRSRFVVQRHRARRLHYDLRLEIDGVLVSWAVPKGPTLDPAARRMAVHVEDHPLEYFDFEGVIPADQYGAGDVIVWDWGTWSHAGDGNPLAAIESGNLHFDLAGQKLRGRFVLVRRSRPDQRGGQEQWLLLHKRDADAVGGWDPEDHPRSVKSGRTNDEVQRAPAASWSSDRLWNAPDRDELRALEEMGASGTWHVGGRRIRLSDLDDVLLRSDGRRGDAVSKREVLRHVALSAPAMLPYLADRAADLGGRAARAPEWVRRTSTGPLLDTPAALVWAVNRGAAEIRITSTTTRDPHHPSWLWFAIEPGPKVAPDEVLDVARLHRTAFDHLGLRTGLVITGTGGLEVWVPIVQRYTTTEAGAWRSRMTAAILGTLPEAGRWLADPVVSDRPETAVVPFSPHAPGGAVSVPVDWDELEADSTILGGWTVREATERLHRTGDPMAPLIGIAQVLPSW